MVDDYRPGCTDKRGYNTKGKAKDARRRAGNDQGVKLYVYKCRWCPLFHLTSMRPEEFRRVRDRAGSTWR